MLGVTQANDFAVTEHAQDLTTKSPQTLYPKCITDVRAEWRCIPGGLSASSRRWLLYAASAWHGFTRHPTVNELTYCLIVQNVMVIVCQIYRRSKNCATLQMTNCLIKPSITHTMFSPTLLPPPS